VLHRGWCAVLATLVVLCLSPAAFADDIAELAARTAASVVHLRIVGTNGEEMGSGSGFFVSEGRIVTNYHVIEEASEAVARLNDGRELEVLGVLASDEDHDLAVVQVATDDNPPPLPLGDGQSVEQGQEVFVIGSPYGLQGTLSTGIVSAVRADGVEDPEHRERLAGWGIQITADVAPGSSGSPVLTHDGQVVAVAVGIVGGDTSVGFGIPVAMLHRLLATIPADAEPQPLPNAVSVWRNLLISAAFFTAIGVAFAIPSLVKRVRKRG
jgi:S1-C subfamily serine protease